MLGGSAHVLPRIDSQTFWGVVSLIAHTALRDGAEALLFATIHPAEQYIGCNLCTVPQSDARQYFSAASRRMTGV
ncbi:hypothetical protein [Brevibacterium marinum]|uniref:Uncharacterized protein n=1 Tax=Brevibacterium marinum TaxID=418643 RepID=A0A846RN92_9MICO|nr:hypothetical protein [Brevibacterium marinum]NJC55179.1 hypothetical protein [Brevibacterium marinum]